MPVVKAIFIFFMGLYTLSKIVDGLRHECSKVQHRIMDLVEIIVGTVLTFTLFKI